jgi:hypothetical protein
MVSAGLRDKQDARACNSDCGAGVPAALKPEAGETPNAINLSPSISPRLISL